jgi:hypothetical protein
VSIEDKRRFKRCPLDTVTGVSRDGEFHFENSVEISEGGMKLITTGDYKVGDRIDVFFFVPKGKFVKAVGEVAYLLPENSHRQVGLRFDEPSESSCEAIREFVNDSCA